MSTDPEKTDSSLEEQLVAYLDGELDAETARRIEERLASEPGVRETLNRLERTWDMLDELGSTPVGDGFTRTTLEMVAVAAEEDVKEAMLQAPKLRRRRFWKIGSVVAAASLAGFFLVSTLLPNPRRELARDLPVLENLEEYRQAGDIDFLRLMRFEKTTFAKPAGAETPPKKSQPPENAPPGELMRWIETLPSDKKAELARKKASFDESSEVERQKLRHLHEKIREDEHPEELVQLMHDYYAWWLNLSSFERNELSAIASPQERIARIEQLKKQNPLQFLTDQDKKVLEDWSKALFFERLRDRFEKNLSAEKRKEWAKKSVDEKRRELQQAFHPQMMRGQPPSKEQFDELQSQLSDGSRNILKGQQPRKQWEIVQSWLFAIVRQGMRGPNSQANENDIADFFEKLPPDQLQKLLNNSPEEMMRDLQFMMKPGFFNRQPGPFPGGPPGPPPGTLDGLPHDPGDMPDREPPRPGKNEKKADPSGK
jgi:hypothetical protein